MPEMAPNSFFRQLNPTSHVTSNHLRIWAEIQFEFKVGLKFGIWRQESRCPDVHVPFQVSGLGLAAKMPGPCATTGALTYKSWPPSADPMGMYLP